MRITLYSVTILRTKRIRVSAEYQYVFWRTLHCCCTWDSSTWYDDTLLIQQRRVRTRYYTAYIRHQYGRQCEMFIFSAIDWLISGKKKHSNVSSYRTSDMMPMRTAVLLKVLTDPQPIRMSRVTCWMYDIFEYIWYLCVREARNKKKTCLFFL